MNNKLGTLDKGFLTNSKCELIVEPHICIYGAIPSRIDDNLSRKATQTISALTFEQTD